MVRYKIHSVTPQRRILEKVVHALRNEDGVCVYPTDTVYGMGVCAVNPKAIDRIGKMLEKDKRKKSEVLEELKNIWPIFVIVILAVIIFMVVNRKPKY